MSTPGYDVIIIYSVTVQILPSAGTGEGTGVEQTLQAVHKLVPIKVPHLSHPARAKEKNSSP